MRRTWKAQTDTLMDLENEKLTAIYTFVRALPEMIVQGSVPPVKDNTAEYFPLVSMSSSGETSNILPAMQLPMIPL